MLLWKWICHINHRNSKRDWVYRTWGVGNNTTIVHNKDMGSDLPRDERSWIQVKTNRHKMEDKFNKRAVNYIPVIMNGAIAN
jgi:hypothetical protein